MKIVQEISLISRGDFEESAEWGVIKNEIRITIDAIAWPVGASNFTINPTRHGNGVKPIKNACMAALQDNFGWQLETQIRFATRSPGRVDATKILDKDLFALEWETGNIAVLKKVRYARCPMLFGPMPDALCPMPYARCRSRTSSF